VENWNLGQVAEVKGREVHELFHPNCNDSACYLETFWPQAWEELAQGQYAECEAEDGVLKRHLSVQVRPISAQTDREGKKTASSAVVIVHDITERKRVEAERERLLTVLNHRTTQLQTAAEVSKSASTILDPEELMNQAVNLIQKQFNFYYVGIFLVDKAGKYAVLQAGTGEAGRQMLEAGHRLAVDGESMIGWSVANAQARIALDVGKEAVRFDNPYLPETRSEMALPLISRGQCIGALTVQSTEEAAFSEEDIAVLQAMADHLAIAIGNARLYDAAQREIIRRKRVEEQLKISLKEKEILLKEIHHRVKNNLQVVSSLLKLQSEYIQNRQMLEMFRESQNRVKSMALIHEKLYQSQDLVKIDFAEYVRNLATYLFRSYRVNPGAITLKRNVDDVSLGIDTAIPCGLIINELVSNSLKHAFPASKEGEIHIAFHSDKDNQFTLIVSDNGAGLPRDLDFRNTESLGLQLVNLLVHQLEGTVELDRSGGTTFRITFAEPKH
jgi:two-component sensor histidine kinase/putative methionine-R-sulfoxide reductase with GAF domain